MRLRNFYIAGCWSVKMLKFNPGTSKLHNIVGL